MIPAAKSSKWHPGIARACSYEHGGFRDWICILARGSSGHTVVNAQAIASQRVRGLLVLLSQIRTCVNHLREILRCIVWTEVPEHA